MLVNRLELLSQLDSVTPGLTPRNETEQSACFAFRDGMVITYNDEISCQHPVLLKKITGAITAAPLLAMLGKLPEESLNITVKNGELRIVGKKRVVELRMEAEISMPLEHVEQPEDWSPLHKDFGEAIGLVQQCASRDQGNVALTCVHVTPRWVEAMDPYQIMRYRLKTGITEPTLIRRENIKHIANLGVTEFCMTETWAHFRNPNGLIYSCRRMVEDYVDSTEKLKETGIPLVLSKSVASAAETAKILSVENVDDEQVVIELSSGTMRIISEGSSGRYRERKTVKYDGDDLTFHMMPSLLVDLCKRHSDFEITEDFLKVNGGKFIYMTALGIADSAGDDEPAPKKSTKKTRSEDEVPDDDVPF
jgi:DNA polymerase III sliding clamp (beta) subunit (PCNA family)